MRIRCKRGNESIGDVDVKSISGYSTRLLSVRLTFDFDSPVLAIHGRDARGDDVLRGSMGDGK